MLRRILATLIIGTVCILPSVFGEERKRLDLQHADLMEVVLSALQDTTFVIGAVVFQSDQGLVYCDSAVWLKGKRVKLMGKVVIDDPAYRLAADSVDYDLISGDATARGSYVELWSRDDSLYAVGHHAFYNKYTKQFNMEERPTVYLRYPDTASMVEVVSDYVQYDGQAKRAQASGNVVINSKDITATSGCAVMEMAENRLDLLDNPVAIRGKSKISGELIQLLSNKGVLALIDVADSAKGEFIEPVDTTKNYYDKSTLTGRRIIMGFDNGLLTSVVCWGQAYSWYNPSPRGKPEFNENSVSGDTIRFTVENERLRQVRVLGGAIGRYISGKNIKKDTTLVTKADTVDYSSEYIEYNLVDSLITLQKIGHVTSGTVTLDAHKITFDTHARLIHAFSAELDSLGRPKDTTLTANLQPNGIPVVLKDKTETLLGDYLEYSIDTEKGRVVQTKSKYETGFYYGQKVFRSNKDIFYIDNGRFTTCDAAEPHFHFYSSHMKLMQNNKLIAKPVVLEIGRIPILALPYYVFPLKKGRHSGFLPFTLGNIERGQRYIRNVGYYWAPSDYWDVRGAIDYYERQHTINFYSSFNYKILYKLDGSFTGNYTKATSYSTLAGSEAQSTRWAVRANHNQDITPTFKISAEGQFQSDASYFQDYSANLSDRLNRTLRSQLNFTKKFSRSVSLSGSFSNDKNLDTRSRVSVLPSLGLLLPTIKPLGSGKINADGVLEPRWYNNLTFTYRPSMTNYSDKQPLAVTHDSIVGTDTLHPVDTTFTSRKYTRIDHSMSLSFPTTIAKYIQFNPTLNYSENWYKIYHTGLSDSSHINTSNFYRTYLYTFSTSLKTTIYGTVYPKVFGLLGFRQTLTPSIGYGFTPAINRYPEVRAYAGGSAGSATRASTVSFGLEQNYQAKVKQGDGEKSLQLLYVSSSFGYNMEEHTFPLSDLVTTYNSNVLPNISFYGNMDHSFYEPGTSNLRFFSPYLMSFSFNTTFSFSGKSFLFDEPVQTAAAPSTSPMDTTRLAQTPQVPGAVTGGNKGWTLAATYSYNESGRGSAYRRSSFMQFSVNFNLTPSTAVSYTQYYDFTGRGTVNNQVSLVKNLHCWTGTFYWVPVGSNRGYGFRLNVSAIPAIKLDNSQSSLSSEYLQSFSR